ncbi:hypothetical protein [Hyphomicrobium facile]|uniref:Uncharacterized protein n=1 Tax=Hyphomicrobium facile TaxID=51670 RepID=A0A1I7NDV3_9HYPH|nr:hypothetical protein [Hyphomicrobium facile]SFV32726.1 hypothetical protein SAMN04488557_1703 [Hyphomicrobium facile]
MQLFNRMGSRPESGDIFVYLDAHWQEDLPLAEELELVFGWDQSAIAMIDDFQVPDDPGYEFDDYGAGRALTPLYIESVCRKFDLATLMPSLRSDDETGSRRGCTVLAHRGDVSQMLLATGLLREFKNIGGIEPRNHALP